VKENRKVMDENQIKFLSLTKRFLAWQEADNEVITKK